MTQPHHTAASMTKREKIASGLMQAFCSTAIPDEMKVKEWFMVMARSSVRATDALIFALNETTNNTTTDAGDSKH